MGIFWAHTGSIGCIGLNASCNRLENIMLIKLPIYAMHLCSNMVVIMLLFDQLCFIFTPKMLQQFAKEHIVGVKT